MLNPRKCSLTTQTDGLFRSGDDCSKSYVAGKAADSGVSIRVVRDLEEIEEIRGTWLSWNRQPNSDIDFYLTVLGHGSGMLRPHVIVLNQDGSPDALLIGRIEDTRLELKIGYRTVFRPRVRMLTLINGGLLGNQSYSNCKSLVEAVKDTLRKGEADLAFFNLFRTDNSFFSCLTLSQDWLGRDHFLALQPHRALVLPGSVEELQHGLSPKVRKNQKWQAKKFLNDYSGNVKVKCFRNTDELEHAIEDIEQVAKKTYQRGLGVGFIDTAFMRQRLRLEAQKGWLRAYVLYAADQPCAFWTGVLYHETFHSASMGYDPFYAKHSPGMFLIMKVVEDFCSSNRSENVREIDFGFGDAQYKEILGNRAWQETSIYLFSPNFRGGCLSLLRVSTMVSDRLVKRVLVHTGLLAKLKKVWRNHLRNASHH